MFAEALALPEDERLKLAAELLASVPPVPGLFVEGTPEFRAELARRVDEVKSGKAQLIPWEEVRKKLLAKVGSKRPKKATASATKRPAVRAGRAAK